MDLFLNTQCYGRVQHPTTANACGWWDLTLANHFFFPYIRRNFFIERVLKGWNRIPREAVESLSLKEFQRHRDTWFMDQLWQSWVMVGLEDLGALFQPKCCYDSLTFAFCFICCCGTSIFLQSQIHSQSQRLEFLFSFSLHLKKFLLKKFLQVVYFLFSVLQI